MTELRSVHEAFNAVMGDVRAIEKSDRNQQQGFRFRGIDAVMQEVGPALRAHGVHIIPTPVEMRSETYETAKGTSMRNVTVTMQYAVYGPAGDSFIGGAIGEAADSGDKAVTKAQSVAYRTFLLQSLTVPTGDADPDTQTHERVSRAEPVADPASVARAALAKVCKSGGKDLDDIAKRFEKDHGYTLSAADAETIEAFTAVISGEVAAR